MRRELSRRCDMEKDSLDHIRRAAESAEGQIEKEEAERTIIMQVDARERSQASFEIRHTPLCHYGRSCKRKPRCPFEHQEGRAIDEEERPFKRARPSPEQERIEQLESRIELLMRKLDGDGNKNQRGTCFSKKVDATVPVKTENTKGTKQINSTVPERPSQEESSEADVIPGLFIKNDINYSINGIEKKVNKISLFEVYGIQKTLPTPHKGNLIFIYVN